MPANDAPLGLIAGNGDFPSLFARAARAAGHTVVAAGHYGETQPGLALEVAHFRWVRVGQLGALIRHFKRHGVTQATMAGGIDKRRLFGRAWPDWRGWRFLARVACRRDDSLLRAVATEFEDAGIRIVGATTWMPEALAPGGVLGRVKPTPAQWRDLDEGLRLARAIGLLDVGQTVVLREGAVVALEAIEGTDACIARAGALTQGRGAVVVKAAKPAQDMRFDVPAIGPKTLAAAAAAGVVALGVEAGRTLLLDPIALVQAADRAGIALVGLSGDGALEHAAAPSTPDAKTSAPYAKAI